MSGSGHSAPTSNAWMAEARAPGSATILQEAPVPGDIPRYEVPGWRHTHGVVAGITGRGGGPDRGFDLGLWSEAPVGAVMERWRAFRGAEPGFSAWALGGQVHGTETATLAGGAGWTLRDRVDGWLTAAPGILLTVTVADCIPVYLAVPGRGVALLHAGWRGTAGGILGRGFERLLALTGAAPAEVEVHCGVGICGGCYEVGAEVLAACGRPAAGAGPWRLDLREVLASEASRLGASVTVSAWCSAHHRPTFYSHRASGGADGRMVAYLGIPRIDSDTRHP